MRPNPKELTPVGSQYVVLSLLFEIMYRIVDLVLTDGRQCGHVTLFLDVGSCFPGLFEC